MRRLKALTSILATCLFTGWAISQANAQAQLSADVAEKIDKLLATRMGFHPVVAPLYGARVKVNIS